MYKQSDCNRFTSKELNLKEQKIKEQLKIILLYVKNCPDDAKRNLYFISRWKS